MSAEPPSAYAARFRQRVVSDCFDAPLADLAGSFDVASIQFALHYMFESRAAARTSSAKSDAESPD